MIFAWIELVREVHPLTQCDLWGETVVVMLCQTDVRISVRCRYFYALCERGAYSHQHEPALSGQRHCYAELHLSEGALLHSPGVCTEGNHILCHYPEC